MLNCQTLCVIWYMVYAITPESVDLLILQGREVKLTLQMTAKFLIEGGLSLPIIVEGLALRAVNILPA